MCVLLVILLLIGLGVFWIEARHRLRPASPLKLRQLDWSVATKGHDLELEGWIEITNPHARMEVMVPELQVKPVLIGSSDLSDVMVRTRITPHHPDEDTRADGYWPAYIVKGHKSTRIKVSVSLSGLTDAAVADRVDTVWMDVHWMNYGPFGRLNRRQGVVVPLRRPAVLQPSKAEFRSGENCKVLPLKTHLLGPLDSTIEVLRDYAGELVQPGDILTIGETPVAVIQGRYTHPSMVEPSWIARLLCRVFHPTSSLATACGLQTLIDQVGPTRVLLAWSIGLALKMVGFKGWFYRLAGDQARLIDDITGTTPPYDQTIVLGPEDPVRLCQDAADTLGVGVAIVDVNDLGRVKVLASSSGCDEALLHRALRPNPAGNANERTPLVLVRPA
ncbi:F420-0:Gamma-glutamyl ligase [Synechococcus sp. MIT S9504]|uniref:F420-0:Gamma-glutamyl ligase n=1 Tax=Synechococcus sp. MIT S9504 TaxID=1801628 RepID=UPI0007BC2A97|nr:F420-0:Gamma-glutamyl ligase [Synechococcus sp. MIT S9504]KZR87861.1 F420-0:Gamma-glutamyl ligase [Synechococcus sp. MIT S9504]